MCVCVLVQKIRPSDEQVGQFWDQNPKGGGGVAYRGTVLATEVEELGIPEGTPVVRWQKGLTKEEMLKLNLELPLPYILHFRQPSQDTSDSLLACHPFQIDADATTGFEGVTPGWVLFHNGHWAEWRKKIEALAIAGFGTPGFKGLPAGVWSDTRGLAWTTHYLNFGFLEMINEKVLCLGPGERDIQMFGGPWLRVKAPDSEDTFVVSNVTWQHSTRINDRRHHGGQTTAAQEATTKLLNAAQSAVTPPGRTGGSAQPDSFRSADGRTGTTAGAGQGPSVRAQQESIQERGQGSGPRTVEARQNGHSDPLRSGVSDGVKRACLPCGKMTPMGTLVNGAWHCFQCWAQHPTARVDSLLARQEEQLWVGTCQKCRVGSSGMKTILGDEWICHTCHETQGKPKIYYARERAMAERGAA